METIRGFVGMAEEKVRDDGIKTDSDGNLLLFEILLNSRSCQTGLEFS